jgi:hypothetical protein
MSRSLTSAALPRHVGLIFGWRSLPQMRRIHARRIIARVANEQPWCQRAIKQRIGNAVCLNALSAPTAEDNREVATLIAASTGVDPAAGFLVESRLNDLRPRLLKRNDGRIQLRAMADDEPLGLSFDPSERSICIRRNRGQFSASALAKHPSILPRNEAA